MKYHYIFFLGNHPEISASEAWVKLQADGFAPQLLSGTLQYLNIETTNEVTRDFLHTLGGTDRIAEIKHTQDHEITASDVLSAITKTTSAKKITIGISTQNVPDNMGITLSQTIKELAQTQDVKIRFVLPRKGTRLNTAQVLRNKLVEGSNAEYTILQENDQWLLAKTIEVQDIKAYEWRDTDRPARDAKVGMLPPKLAQIMINLGLYASNKQDLPIKIYDPFCGMGTILQEAWLLDLASVGSDKETRMVEFTQRNLTSLSEHFLLSPELRPNVFTHDVTQPFPNEIVGSISTIVTEPYLGHPLRTPLSTREAVPHIDHLAALYMTFLKNAHSVLPKNGRILMLLPAFRRGSRKNDTFSLFPTGFLDAVASLGYSQIQLIPETLHELFPPSSRNTVLYARADALVGRELILWEKHE